MFVWLSIATFIACAGMTRADPLADRSRLKRELPTEAETQEFLDAINSARADRNASGMNELVSETFRFKTSTEHVHVRV